MKVTIVNERKQHFNGKNYWCGRGKSRYYKRVFRGRSYALHRAVWEYHYDTIPPGLTINHKDWDWHNNQIENIELMTQAENNRHQRPEATENRRNNMLKVALPKASEWHRSEAGKAWHREHAKKTYAKRKPVTKNCAQCHEDFETTQIADTARFCHPNCKMRARTRRLKGLPEDYGLFV